MDKVIILDDYRKKNKNNGNEEPPLPYEKALQLMESITDKETKKQLFIIDING